MDKNMIVSISPHVRSKDSTATIMRDVCIALIPAIIASIIFFGIKALLLEIVCVIACVFFEWAFEKICHRPITIKDGSAVVTGLLLAMNLTSTLPIWEAVVGCFISIVVVKQLFGGIGKNFANPAIVGRIFLFLAFTGGMTDYCTNKFDTVSSATPLAVMASGEAVNTMDLFLGKCGGVIGETCAIALLIGFVYLLIRKVITWHTPVVYVAVVFVLESLLGGSLQFGLNEILAGGLMLGAIFMATDYVSTPATTWGRVIFGAGCGILTVLIRQWGSYAEGVSFSILFMNILTPYISKWTESKAFGGVKA